MPTVLRGNDDFKSDDVDFTIIYPNGGTAATPANVSINSRYVEANPFPGFSVVCEVEIFFDAVWGGAGWHDVSADAYGVRVNQLDTQFIVVQTGETGLMTPSNLDGSPFGRTTGNVTAPTPCRVKVWKVKGATV